MEKSTKTVLFLGIIMAFAILIGGLVLWGEKKVNNADVNIKTPNGSVSVNGNNVNIKSPNGEVNVGDDLTEKVMLEEKIEKKSNTVLIFDASGSMAEKINGQSKIQTAKESAINFVNELTNKKGNYLSIVVYGHKGSSNASDKAVSCAGIEEVYPMSIINSATISSKINSLSANGWTPIASSLEKAKNILSENNSEGTTNSVILVSDGEETCGGNPVAKAQELCNASIKVVTNVIGFNVSGAQEAQLKAIAKAGCGTYYSVNSKQELDNAFVKIKGGTVDVNDGSGTNVHVDESNVNVNAPGANVKVDESGVKINVPGVNIDL